MKRTTKNRQAAAQLLGIMGALGGSFGPSAVSPDFRPRVIDLHKQAQKRAARDARLARQVQSGHVQPSFRVDPKVNHEYIETILKKDGHEWQKLTHKPGCRRCAAERSA